MRSGVRLASETLDRRGVLHKFCGQNPDGDVAPQTRVGSAINLAHSARADSNRTL